MVWIVRLRCVKRAHDGSFCLQRKLRWSGMSAFDEASHVPWFAGSKQAAGFVRRHGALSFITVLGAGAPAFRPIFCFSTGSMSPVIVAIGRAGRITLESRAHL